MSTTFDPASTESAPDESELFDSSQYKLPIPEENGLQANQLRIALGGGIDLDLYDEQALQFLDNLKLGRDLDLTVTVSVTGSSWRYSVKGEDETEHTVHTVSLKAHTIRMADFRTADA